MFFQCCDAIRKNAPGIADEYMERLEKINMPMVFIDREYKSEKISSVVIDNDYGVTQAVEYLIKLGHRRIGYVHGVENFDEKARFSEMYLMLVRGAELPDAFFCANDEMAWGCIRAMQAMGVQVPEQVSIVGFDDSLLAAYYSPALTTVHSPVVELGSKSATEIIRLVRREGIEEGTSIRLDPRLILRDSCKLAK